MEALKNAMAVLAGVVGLLTGLLTLYAKYLDIKKAAARKSEETDAAAAVIVAPKPTPTLGWVDVNIPEKTIVSAATPTHTTSDVIMRSREAVKAPAITLLIAGLVSLFFNLTCAGYGYVDRFVTPLSPESKNRQAMMAAIQRHEIPPPVYPVAGVDDALSSDATVVLTICMLMCLSIASAAAAWAGYGMLRLKSYWLSVAGSFAIMAGGSFCCMAGIPIGIWSLSVLYKPDVASSFR